MGLFDWFKPKPKRSINQVARELSEAVFALHPAAEDRVIVTIDGKHLVHEMFVPTSTSGGPVLPAGDRGEQVARVSALIAELAGCGLPVQGHELTVMRDRVIWMPAVLTFPTGA